MTPADLLAVIVAAASASDRSDFRPGALVLPDPNCRVAHVIRAINETGIWWFAECNRSGRTDGERGDRSAIVPDGTPVCARCQRRQGPPA